MLGRVVAFAAVLSVLAVSAPSLAPGLLSAVLHPERDTAGEKAPPAAVLPAPLPPAQTQARPADNFRRVALSANPEGHFVADAVIDGGRVTVMVDTGATMVALTEKTARSLGLNPAQSAFSERLSTANGVVMAARATLSEVRLGNVVLRDVAAVIVPGNALPVDLLGMSFLGRLSKFEIASGQLVLSQ